MKRKDNTKSNAIIKVFTQWLQTMSEKKKSKLSASQHASHAFKVWKALGDEVSESVSEDLELTVITADNGFDNVETKRVTTNPGTLRSYLGSFTYFLQYLKKEATQELADDLLKELTEDVVNYNWNLRQAVAERKAEYACRSMKTYCRRLS